MADATTTPKPEEDPFSAAFAELSKEDNTPVIVPAADPVLDGAEADAAAAEAAKPALEIEIEGALPDPKTVKPDGTDPAAVETKPAAAAPAADDAMLERFRQIIAETKPAAAAPAPAAAAPVAEPPPAISPYTPEEQAAVESYIKDWPDVYAAQQAIAKRDAQAVVDHVFTQLRPILAQLQGTTQHIVQSTHSEQLQAAIPDITEVAPKLVEWVSKQPDYLRDGMQAVVDRGSVPQVLDLVKRYRAETGTPEPAAKETAPAPQLKLVPKPDPAKIAKALVPTKGLRSGVQSDMVQSDDYDGAFAAFSQVI